MNKDKIREITNLLHKLYLKSEEEFYIFENKIKEVIQEPNDQ